MTSTHLIVVGANEDGFGPSALVFYVVRELIRAARAAGQPLAIRLLNSGAADFNRALYAADAPSGSVEVHSPRPDSLIRLEKRHGEIDVRATLALCRGYRQAREDYFEAVRPLLAGARMVIDFGVPALVRAAEQLGIAHRVTLMDHSWAATLRLCCAREWERVYQLLPPPGDEERRAAGEIGDWIEEDEARAGEVWLLPDFLAPAEFRAHWQRLPPTVHVLPGVLGGGVDPVAARRRLEKMLAGSGQAALGADGRRLVMISPGGTPVWTDLLPEMVSRLARAPRDWLPVFSAPRAATPELTSQLKHQMRRSGRVWWFDFLEGATQQAIMPAFDLVVTRAGGGTVNDAVATRTPFVCVQEPFVQVELIRRECLRRGLAPDMPEMAIARFRQDPIGALDRFAESPRVDLAAKGIAAGAERVMVAHLLATLRGD